MAKTLFAVCQFFAMCCLVADGKDLLCRPQADGKELADGKLANSSSATYYGISIAIPIYIAMKLPTVPLL